LRKALGPDVLLTRDPGYVLDVRPEQTDLGRFERLTAEARATESAAARAEKLRNALALWRGQPIRNTLMPLRAICRRAVARGEVTVNPTTGLQLPAVRGRRDRIASPTEAAELIEALPERDRALWATALYAGLTRGELMALRWEDVDLQKNVITVARSWDVKAGPIEPKSQAGKRTVPIATVLREYLIAQQLRSGRREGLVFGSSGTRPFTSSAVRRRALTAWKTASNKRKDTELLQLEPIALHECRHTFASLMIGAGVNPKALSVYMGHASVMITLDRYGHLFPGNEEEAAGLLDGYLARAIAGLGIELERVVLFPR
jgi:integrase